MQFLRSAVFLIGMAWFAGYSQAGMISFSFDGDAADWPWIGREFQPGTVSGVLYGLVDAPGFQFPTSIGFTSDMSALGITSSIFIPTAYDGGIQISGGVIQSDSSLMLNFNDPVIGAMQFRLNSAGGRNALHWNGSSGPVAGMGNADGFSGATYSTLSDSTATPEPASLCIWGGIAIVGLAAVRRRKRI
jgi:hypothetical protein